MIMIGDSFHPSYPGEGHGVDPCWTDSARHVFESHNYCMVAQAEPGSDSDSSVDQIGCDSIPFEISATGEAMEQSEVYEYVLLITSGDTQLNFQMSEPSPHAHTEVQENKVIVLLPNPEQDVEECVVQDFALHPDDDDADQLITLPEDEVLGSRYIVGKPLGQGGYGSVYAGIRRADGKMVAIKHVEKSACNKYITIPGETDSLPLEVALLQLASVPPRCNNVVELLEWFEMSSSFVLVMERPSPCMDLYKFCKRNGRLPEPLARDIMWQVVRAACHCCDRGILHGDIKPDNLLINTETLQVKLIDFGCGALLKDSPYTSFAGTPVHWPPEWIERGECMGRPATVWSLGVLLYFLVCLDYPFDTKQETAHADITLCPSLSRECEHLISWCLDKDPSSRATFENIINHEWFKKELYVQGCLDELAPWENVCHEVVLGPIQLSPTFGCESD